MKGILRNMRPLNWRLISGLSKEGNETTSVSLRALSAALLTQKQLALVFKVMFLAVKLKLRSEKIHGSAWKDAAVPVLSAPRFCLR